MHGRVKFWEIKGNTEQERALMLTSFDAAPATGIGGNDPIIWNRMWENLEAWTLNLWLGKKIRAQAEWKGLPTSPPRGSLGSPSRTGTARTNLSPRWLRLTWWVGGPNVLLQLFVFLTEHKCSHSFSSWLYLKGFYPGVFITKSALPLLLFFSFCVKNHHNLAAWNDTHLLPHG